MIIGIDGNEANIEKRVGVNQYAFEILKNIHKLQAKSKNKHKVIVYLSSKPHKDLPKENSNWKYKIISGKRLWIITRLMPRLILNKEKLDVFFSPGHYLPLISSVPQVCTIHDLGYLMFSGQFKKYDFWQLKLWTASSVFISKAIIAVSNSTKKDIVRHYPSVSKKIGVARHGYDSKRFNTEISEKDVRRVKNKYSIVGDYVLFISTLKPSKNIEGLLVAWKLVLRDFPEYQLVIAGKKGWLYTSIFKKVKELRLENKVIFTDFIAEEDKPGLIAGAKAFVLPSFWEGFGMDVLTAMACGIPVVVSSIEALREVAGEAGTFIDPHQPASITKGIKKVLTMGEQDKQSIINKGFKQAKKFSWEKTAKETIKVLERVGTS